MTNFTELSVEDCLDIFERYYLCLGEDIHTGKLWLLKVRQENIIAAYTLAQNIFQPYPVRQVSASGFGGALHNTIFRELLFNLRRKEIQAKLPTRLIDLETEIPDYQKWLTEPYGI